MTIKGAIELVDRLEPNQYSQIAKVKWLSHLDGQIFLDVMATHVCDWEAFQGYGPDTPVSTALLVPYPYDEDIYNYYLQAKINQENGEISKYNQSISLYNNAFLAFQNWFNRTYPPKPTKTRFLF